MSLRKIILDTSFLMSLVEFSSLDVFIDLFRGYEFLIPESVVKELEDISKKSNIKGRKAMLILKLLEKVSFKTIESHSDIVDQDILILATKYNAFIATTDRELRKKANELGIKVIYFNHGNYIRIQ